MQVPEGGKMRISPKLSVDRANQGQIRNQRVELRRIRLFLGRKAGGGVLDQCHLIELANSESDIGLHEKARSFNLVF